jgi:threonyl-tRNA synthetase
MHVLLPDGKRLEVPDHATGGDVAAAIGPGLARAAMGVVVDGELSDLVSEVHEGASVSILTGKDEKVITLMRHTLAHVMAQAVREYFVGQGFDVHSVKPGIGPVIDKGFYYDFDLPRTLTPGDLEAIEALMRTIISAKLPLKKFERSRHEALDFYQEQENPYKLELIRDLPEDGPITFYQQGDDSGFIDLCRGPHIPHTGVLPKHFKLLSVAGAYWRGDEQRPMLQRIYGAAFRTEAELEQYLWQLEQAKLRDHRRLGKELDIFTLDDEVGPGLPLWLPRGTVIVEQLESLAKELEQRGGYQRVRSPHLSKESLFLKSGHLPYYADSMYPPMELEGIRYYVKPMNCPFHHKIYASRPHSYRDLPIRLAEYGTCYRYEKSGELFGLMRVRSMQMNDAHIYCNEEQFEAEFMRVIDLYLEYFKLFGIDDYLMRLSTHGKAGLGKKYVDNEVLWEKTEAMVRNAMDRGGVPYVEVADEAAFYGPKIDVQIKSAIGREFTLATNQVDFAQPERFALEYIDADNRSRVPLCIHRAPLGTHERTIGFLLEHFNGDFPVWIAPEQVRVVPIADRHKPYARSVQQALIQRGLRSEVDERGERMNAKVRDAELLKIPYIVVVGDQEQSAATVSFRSRKEPDRQTVPTESFAAHVARIAAQRQLEVEPLP